MKEKTTNIIFLKRKIMSSIRLELSFSISKYQVNFFRYWLEKNDLVLLYLNAHFCL